MVQKRIKSKPSKLEKEKKEVTALSFSEILAKINYYLVKYDKIVKE
jgi:hypothetical protein